MTPFAWNGLRVGDAVVVHDLLATVPGGAVLGQVAYVHTGIGRKGNEVGVRCSTRPLGADVMWPGRLQVHLPNERSDCPWCAIVN
jgi:hypothetical protein